MMTITTKETVEQENIHCLLIDLDDTLYPHTNGLWEMIRSRINQFMIEEMNFPPEVVPTLRHRLWQQYGTTLRGLQQEYRVDSDNYLRYVHNVPVESIIQPDQKLSCILEDLPQRKFVFTNADINHAQRILNALGVTSLFEGIIDIHQMTPYCKPQVEAFKKALSLIAEDPESCLMVDDSPDNLETAYQLGMMTASIGQRQHTKSVHLESIHALGELLEPTL